MSQTHETTIEIMRQVKVEVRFSATAGSRGSRDRFGVPLEPDEPAEIIIESVKDEQGKEVDLTDEDHDRLVEQIAEELS